MEIKKHFEFQDDLIAGEGVSEIDIAEAEEKLGIRFAMDYHQYLLDYGIAAVNGHELTGISSSERTNVVSVTTKYREADCAGFIPLDWYIIEESNIDGIIVWQASSGEIYQVRQNNSIKICDSLCEYIDT